jgi:protein TonB
VKLMDSKYVIQFSRSGEMALMDQNRHIVGAVISFFVHAVGICCIIFASSALSNFKPPMVIDFSIEKSYGDTTPKKTVAKIERKQNQPAPKIKKIPPAPKPLPEKPKVIPKKIEPLLTKKAVVEEKVPEQIVTEPVPELHPEKQIVQEEILPEQVASSEDSMVDDLDKAAGPVIVKSAIPPKEQYVKEHFLYIKESVQKKIAYPRMARKMGWQGRVLISFVICRDGSVKNIRIVESSGFKALDKNAVEAIQKEAPFPKPPVSAEIIIPVTYKLS